MLCKLCFIMLMYSSVFKRGYECFMLDLVVRLRLLIAFYLVIVLWANKWWNDDFNCYFNLAYCRLTSDSGGLSYSYSDRHLTLLTGACTNSHLLAHDPAAVGHRDSRGETIGETKWQIKVTKDWPVDTGLRPTPLPFALVSQQWHIMLETAAARCMTCWLALQILLLHRTIKLSRHTVVTLTSPAEYCIAPLYRTYIMLTRAACLYDGPAKKTAP